MLKPFGTSFARLSKKFLQNHYTIILKNTLGDFAAVIQIGGLNKIPETACSTTLRIRAAKNDPTHATMHDGSSAHWAGFLGHEKIAVRQPPIAHDTLGLSQCDHLRMGRGILERLHLVPCPRDDFALVNNDRPNWHFMLLGGFAGLTQSLTHVASVIGDKYVGLETQALYL